MKNEPNMRIVSPDLVDYFTSSKVAQISFGLLKTCELKLYILLCSSSLLSNLKWLALTGWTDRIIGKVFGFWSRSRILSMFLLLENPQITVISFVKSCKLFKTEVMPCSLWATSNITVLSHQLTFWNLQGCSTLCMYSSGTYFPV
jgi:hypothetical protein